MHQKHCNTYHPRFYLENKMVMKCWSSGGELIRKILLQEYCYNFQQDFTFTRAWCWNQCWGIQLIFCWRTWRSNLLLSILWHPNQKTTLKNVINDHITLLCDLSITFMTSCKWQSNLVMPWTSQPVFESALVALVTWVIPNIYCNLGDTKYLL